MKKIMIQHIATANENQCKKTTINYQILRDILHKQLFLGAPECFARAPSNSSALRHNKPVSMATSDDATADGSVNRLDPPIDQERPEY